MDALAVVRDSGAVVWDLDGTLVRLAIDWPGLREALRIECRRRGLAERPGGAGDLFDTLGEAGAADEALSILARFESAALWTPITGMASLVRSLDGRAQAIYSDNLEATIERVLTEADLRECFARIVGREWTRGDKPGGRGMSRVLEALGPVPADRITLVGDSWRDRAAARTCGMTFISAQQLAAQVAGGLE